ncbi:hypothetical protein [Hydrogenophaga sp. 2FB]|uniref:hypothetical protein n=1 Tax=Hydrogenophaga sp. 2FB TaxID=2502187 RepID=UPI0010F67A2F|nr:hypothetical protein [Hydrogenophaga sp. 2FB]
MAENHDPREEFNRAIDFAIEQGVEAATFLRSWREGDTSEWPEFAAQPPQLQDATSRAEAVKSKGKHHVC